MASSQSTAISGAAAEEAAESTLELQGEDAAEAFDGDDDASTEVMDGAEAAGVDEKEKELAELKAKWPGWPGYSVFRVVVPVLKVGGIIGRKGDIIKKLVEDTRARIRVLDGPATSPDRIVLISGKDEPEAAVPPATDAIIRIFKRVNGLLEDDGDGKALGSTGAAFCSFRLLVASTQATSLIGKHGSVIKFIQESTGATIRVLSSDELPVYSSSDERVVDLQGEAAKVLKGLEAVVGHLRKFLLDHTVLPLFEKSYNAPATQERQVETWSEKTSLHTTPQTTIGSDCPVSLKRDSLFIDRESHIESCFNSSRLSVYGADHGLGSRFSAIGHSGGPIVTQVAQTMQVPLAYAEDIIGVQGSNIDYIRITSGATLTVQESRGPRDEITVEIRGTSSQVQVAQQLIQDFTTGHREQLPGSYGKLESSLRHSYSQLGSSSYSSLTGQPYSSYGSSGVGGYSNFRL